ncbi:MAG: GNAT family N-acetyltransferase [Candidatus Obscuribacterales bacterium]|nr:GNAT family N-acetyltransferase [Candidatus Obscuribacterales bacterium]
MNNGTYNLFVRRQQQLQEATEKLVAKWSQITGITVEKIARITFTDDTVIVRFREFEVLPDGVQRSLCERDLALPANLLWCKNRDEKLLAEVLSSIKIRQAVESDAYDMVWTHWKAVHITAANYGYYGPKILEDWSPKVSAERITLYREWVRTFPQRYPDKRVTVVAELAKRIIGFASYVPEKNYLLSLYVSPQAAGKKVGVRLLQEMERLARGAGCTYLELDAAINAEGFYVKHGYERIAPIFYTLHTGLEMPCVKMQKQL